MLTPSELEELRRKANASIAYMQQELRRQKIPLGAKGNPVIGCPPPPGYRFEIVGKWPDGHIEGSGPQTDQEVLRLYEGSEHLETVKRALYTLRTRDPAA